MEHTTPSNPAPAPSGPGVPALSPDAERQAVLDRNGFDLDDFDWIPVKRKPRVDGWSAERAKIPTTALWRPEFLLDEDHAGGREFAAR